MATQEELQRQGRGPSPQRGALALANQRRVERTQSGLYGTPRTQEQTQVDTGLPGYQDRVNAIPGPNDNDLAGMARVNARFKPGVPATQRPTAEQPAVPQQPSQNYDFQPDPMQGPAMGLSVRNTSVDGIRRIDNAPGPPPGASKNPAICLLTPPPPPDTSPVSGRRAARCGSGL